MSKFEKIYASLASLVVVILCILDYTAKSLS
jgi:hypothetical protein